MSARVCLRSLKNAIQFSVRQSRDEMGIPSKRHHDRQCLIFRNVVDVIKNGAWDRLCPPASSGGRPQSKCQLGRRPEKKPKAKRISIEGNRSIGSCVHRDLSDSRKTENSSQETHLHDSIADFRTKLEKYAGSGRLV
jgi:hypothetical protein